MRAPHKSTPTRLLFRAPDRSIAAELDILAGRADRLGAYLSDVRHHGEALAAANLAEAIRKVAQRAA